MLVAAPAVVARRRHVEDSRDVGLQVDALAAERVDPFAGLVRVDEVDDGFACGGFACDVVPRLERRLTAHASHSAMFAAYVVGAGGLLGGDAWARPRGRSKARTRRLT